MAHPRPLIPLPPPVLNNVVRLPPQPQNPPTDNDLKYAAYFAKDVLNSHGRGEVRTSDLAAALKYKAVVIAKADHNVAPPWFQGAIDLALEPIKRRLDAIEGRLDAIEGRLDAIEGQTIEVKRMNTIAFNWQLGQGEGMNFREVPFPDGSYPSDDGERFPPLTSAAIIEGLDGHQCRAYHESYYPGQVVPNSLQNRRRAIMRAIGCQQP